MATVFHLAIAGNKIPNTPAGNALRSWLSAFNSGESTHIESFDQAHAPWLTLDGMMRRRASSGGYDSLRIEREGDFWIVFRARERKSSAEVIGSMVVRSYEPGHVTLLSFVPASAHSMAANLDTAERIRVIDGAAKLLDEYYLYPDVARKVSAKLKALQEHGEYRGITDGEIFAVRLGDDLVELSGDKHIGVDFFPKSAPGPQPRRDMRWLLWTLPNLPGKKFAGKPVFVLTASSTFSAGEEFAYDLKSLKRATVVGETTGGGAHVMAPHRIDAHFVIRVPFARFVNPITKTDWEGIGVEPNVKVSAADALAVAEKLAAGEHFTEERRLRTHAGHSLRASTRVR